jgi:hypothetical protein
MRLRPGATIDQAINLLTEISRGGLNNVRNSIPRIGSPSFDQLMTPAVLGYERWTKDARTQLSGSPPLPWTQR